MENSFFRQEIISSSEYRLRTPNHYLSALEPQIIESFTPQQLEVIKSLLEKAIPQSSPKIVDLRFVVDLIFSRFYVVLFVGRDLRNQKRFYSPKGMAKVGNLFAAIILLIGTNLVISAFIILIAYLLKSGIGIDLFSGEHITDVLKRILNFN